MTVYDISEPATELTPSRRSKVRTIGQVVVVNAAVITFFVFATLKYINRS